MEDEPDGELVTISEQHNAVFDAAQRAGFPMTAADMDKAVAFMADYSPEWVLEAVRRASGGTREQRCWRYVGGILRRWKAAGGMDEAQRPQPAQTARSGTRTETNNPFLKMLMDMEDKEREQQRDS